jgi:hypothetical protein
MKWSIAVLLVCVTALRPAPADDVPVLPSAESILAGVAGALPDIPLLVNAELQSKSKDGKLERRFQVEMLLDWNMDPPGARYTLRDGFGATLSHLSLSWPAGGPAEYRYFTGTPLQSAPVPNLAEPIEGTDLAWMDLSLAFLWWPDGMTRGTEEVKGRECYVLDIPAPADAFTGCSGVRVWIDPRISILLRAEAYGMDDQRQRRLEVKSFRKINDRWFIKDIEVQSYPSRHKTILRVRDVQDRERKQYLDRDNSGPETPEEEAAPAPEYVEPVTPVSDLAIPETTPETSDNGAN